MLETSCTLYVGNLSFYTTEEQIYELFSRAGDLKRIVMGLDKVKKTPCGFCFIEYPVLLNSAGADPGFFLGEGAPLRNGVTNTNKPHFFAEYQLYWTAVGHLREGCALPVPSP